MISVDIAFLEFTATRFAGNPSAENAEALQHAAIHYAHAVMEMVLHESTPSHIIEDAVPTDVFVPRHDELIRAIEQSYKGPTVVTETVAEKDARLHAAAQIKDGL